jgi:hypothetical protein
MVFNDSVSDLDLNLDTSDAQRTLVLLWHEKHPLLRRFCSIIGKERYQSELATAVAWRKSATGHARDIYENCLEEDCTSLNANNSCSYRSNLEGIGDPNSAFYHSSPPKDPTRKHPEIDSLVDALVRDHNMKVCHQASTSRRSGFPGRSIKRMEATTHDETTEETHGENAEDDLIENDGAEIDSSPDTKAESDTERGLGRGPGKRFERLSARFEDLKTSVKKRGRFVYLPCLRSPMLTQLRKSHRFTRRSEQSTKSE